MAYYKIKTLGNFRRISRDNWPLMILLTVVIQEETVFYYLAIASPLANLKLALMFKAVQVISPISAQLLAIINFQTLLLIWTLFCRIKRPILDLLTSTLCQLALTLRVLPANMFQSVVLSLSPLIQ